MKFSTKTRYGLRAMLEIALNHAEGGIFQKDISVNQEISNKYLDHIIHALKVAQLITKKGKKGGYILARDPSDISVYDINNAFEPGICVIECLEKSNNCSRETGCRVKGFWSKLNNIIIAYLKSTTLEDLVYKRIVIDDFNFTPKELEELQK
ncbi:MAG: Rrf2 family transcriptional regulator [Bacteroidales bacterium]|nr:Rrf2 family transcriptional regulator [Bacteroidales bacterium]